MVANEKDKDREWGKFFIKQLYFIIILYYCCSRVLPTPCVVAMKKKTLRVTLNNGRQLYLTS